MYTHTYVCKRRFNKGTYFSLASVRAKLHIDEDKSEKGTIGIP